MKASEDTPKITLFCPILDNFQMVCLENQMLREQLVNIMKLKATPSGNGHIELQGFLKDLVDCAVANNGKTNKKSWRYGDSVKDVCV